MMTIPVIFAIGEIMAMLIADQISQGKTVMAGNKVNAGIGASVRMLKNIAVTMQATGEGGQLPRFASHETPYGIAIIIIPFAPARRKMAGLITARTDIPGFGNQLATA